MKKWILIFTGAVLLGALAVGAVKTFVVAPRTVADIDSILEVFFEARQSFPPVPAPLDYKVVIEQISEDRFDFLADPQWAFTHSAGTLYLSEKSKLKLQLPMQLVAYEDLMSGSVVLVGTPVGSKTVQTLAIVDAPDFSAFSGKASLDKYLMDELWPRRLIWTAVLREEAAWVDDLLSAQEQVVELSMPMMMAMSASETIMDFRIVQDGTNLSVNLPEEFVGASLSLMKCSNLVDAVWSSVFQTNVASTGMLFLASADIPDLMIGTSTSTNFVGCAEHSIPDVTCTNCTSSVTTNTISRSGGVIFYRASATSTNDPDNDGLDNVSEYEAGTDYQDSDSDDDALSDGEEVLTYGLDPNDSDTNGDGVPDAIDANMQGTTGEDGVLIILPDGGYRHMPESVLNLNSYGAYGE